MDKTRGNKEINQFLEFELLDSMLEKLSSIIGDHGYFEAIECPERPHSLHHLWMRLRLGEHEGGDGFAREGARLVKDDPIKIFV